MGEGAEVGIFRAFLILWKRHVASSGDHMLARDIKPDHLRAEALGERGSSLERALIVSESGKQCCQPVHQYSSSSGSAAGSVFSAPCTSDFPSDFRLLAAVISAGVASLTS